MIRAELVSTNFVTRWPCHVCGGHTEKYSVLCEVPDSHPTHAGLRICEKCLRSRDFDTKLTEQAAALESHAAALRRVIGQIEAPAYEEWQHAEDLCNALRYGASDEDVSFDEAMTWPREKRDQVIAEAEAFWKREDAEASAFFAREAERAAKGAE